MPTNPSEQIDAVKQQQPGTTGGFHYGTPERPCNGVYQASDDVTEDDRRIYYCDACGSAAVRSRGEFHA